MEYIQEALDRTTGRLKTQSLGDWITVSELGQRYGVGNKKVRCILHHMGVLAREGRCYRLPHRLVEAGIGKRIDFPRSGHAFDTISPKGQELVATIWAETAEGYETETGNSALVATVREALAVFNAARSEPLETAGEVRWVLDHFRDIKFNVMATALEVSPALVTRYARHRATEIAYRKRKMEERLQEYSGAEKLSRMVALHQDDV